MKSEGKSKDFKLDIPFGLQPDKYLLVSQKEAMIYLAKEIIPRIKRVVDENREKFIVIYALGATCEQISDNTVKTCGRYNQDKGCRESNVHTDLKGIKRMHACTICWEVLWVYSPHQVVNCPLLVNEFWSKIGANRILKINHGQRFDSLGSSPVGAVMGPAL